MASEAQSVGGILDSLGELARDRNAVSVEDVKRAFGRRSYGPFLLVPALVELTPIGSIPGVPTILALLIVLFAAQLLWGRSHLWLPGWIARRSISAQRLDAASERLRPLAARLDHWFHGRLPRFTTRAYGQFAAAICILLCLTVPFLEIVPLASSVPMGAIALFGLALLVRDGALMLTAMAVSVAAIGVGGWLWFGGGPA